MAKETPFLRTKDKVYAHRRAPQLLYLQQFSFSAAANRSFLAQLVHARYRSTDVD